MTTATAEQLARCGERQLLAALDADGDGDTRLRSCFERAVALAVEQSAAARVCIVEAGAGSPATDRVEQAVRLVGRRAVAVAREDGDRAELGGVLIAALVVLLRAGRDDPAHGRELARIPLPAVPARPVALRLRLDAARPRRTLRKLCQEAAIPAWMRDRLPVLWVDGEPAWVGGIGVSAAFACRAGEAGILPRWLPAGGVDGDRSEGNGRD